MTQKFYSVITKFYDNGKVIASYGDETLTAAKPENSKEEKNNHDLYIDWFDTWEEAKKFHNDALKA